MVSGVVDVADVPLLDRLLKKSVSGVLSRSDRSTYRLVRLAVRSPCGLADDLFEQPVDACLQAIGLEHHPHSGGLRLAGLKRAGGGWTLPDDLDDDEEEHDIEHAAKPQDISLNPASVPDLFL